MKIRCIWEHNGGDSLLYSADFPGAFARGRSVAEAMRKMPTEIAAYRRWLGDFTRDVPELEIVQEKSSTLTVSDADSDVLFDEEKKPLSRTEYEELKTLALKSAQNF